jgi:phospholipid/cholesterol/gamma-HCH transport system substrate-binding protein
MRRAVVILAALILLGGAAAVSQARSSGDPYVVRAIFDNAAFVVPGEDVRVAGANVGSVQSVDVTLPGEVDSLSGGPHAIPGKAVVVIDITDPGFANFRRDASCLIRPQSLIGEKYIECRPTLPRRPGQLPPPPLRPIPSGQPGAGEYLLPVENNGKSVDIDLVQDTLHQPYGDRLRLILNDLGAGLAARGHDLAQIVRRGDPALRDTDRLLGILARQRHQLTDLAVNSERILRPLAAQRRHVSGFFANAGVTAQATASQGPALEAALAKLPHFLDELRRTMARLNGFSEQAQPVVAELGRAAPSLTRATNALGPFSRASIRALRSLGRAGVTAGPKVVRAQPVVRKTGTLARSGVSPTTNLARFLTSIRKTNGFEGLMELIYNTTGSVNGFDRYGHYLRATLVATNCVDYVTAPLTGCDANFTHAGTLASPMPAPSVADAAGGLASPAPKANTLATRDLLNWATKP